MSNMNLTHRILRQRLPLLSKRVKLNLNNKTNLNENYCSITSSSASNQTLTLFKQRNFTTEKNVTITKTTSQDKSSSSSSTTTDPKQTSLCEEQNQIEEKLIQLQEEIKTQYRNANYEGALHLSSQLLEASIHVFGEGHPVTASAHNNIGLMNKQLGKYNVAVEHYQKSVDLYADVAGKDHENYAMALHNLALCLRSQVLFDEELSNLERIRLNDLAIEYLEQALVIRVEELGNDHPYTIMSRSNLGGIIASQVLYDMANNIKNIEKYQSKWHVAEEHLRQALQTSIDSPHGDQIVNESSNNLIRTKTAAVSAQNLALFLKHKADFLQSSQVSYDDNSIQDLHQEALSLYSQALTTRRELLGKDHPESIATFSSLAELYVAIGKQDEADKIREEIMEIYNIKEVDEDEFHRLEKEHK